MVFDITSTNNNSVWSDVLHLEALQGGGIQVFDVGEESKKWVTETVESVGSSEQEVIDIDTGTSLDSMGILILSDGNIGGHDRSWLDGTVGNHIEDVHNIMGKAGSLEDGVFLVVVHGEGSSRLLNHTVVDGLICVQNSFVVGVFEGKKGSASGTGLIPGTNIEENLESDCTWNIWGFRNDGDAVFKGGDAHFVVSNSGGLCGVSVDGGQWTGIGNWVEGIIGIWEIPK